MPVFEKRFYSLGDKSNLDIDGYRAALLSALSQCISFADRDKLLRQEAVEITRHVTDGIRDLIKHDRRIRRLVLDQGAVPLATWAEALDTLAEHSMPALKRKIVEMQRDLEHGRIEGFPGTMILYGKPTFATFEDFYRVVFEQAEDHPATSG
jgi:hypothetical protein